MEDMTKEERYSELYKTVVRLIDPKAGMTANMANLSSLLHYGFGFLWTGFYIVREGELVLGPFQGPLACTRIQYGRGVCGSAWKSKRTMAVPDVEEFPGHIACSGESRSEIVVPVWSRGEIVAVLDIDSRETGTFDGTDCKWLELICAELSCGINPELREYVGKNIIPLYDDFDKGHGRDHVESVIVQALSLCVRYDVNPDVVYAAAAWHDTGLCGDRKRHNVISAEIVRADRNLARWFTDDEIELIADAAEDHRASLGREPRTIYGKLVSESDRLIVPEKVIRRCIQYGIAHCPEYGKEAQYVRVVEHLEEKYGDDGYMKLWIPESPNAGRMKALRDIIRDRARLRRCFDEIYDEECAR